MFLGTPCSIRSQLLCGCLAAVAFAAVLASGGQANAQGDDMQRAKDAFSRGQSHYDVGEFNEAREAFQLSFDAFPHFRTIFNLALCEEKLGNVAAAVELYHRYLNWSGDVPARDDVEKKLVQIRQNTQLPVGVGFGVKDAETAKTVAGIADGVVVGSALISKIENNLDDPDAAKREVIVLIESMRLAMDSIS
jgi:tetratricopeptide (TPR) repeat protein